MAWGDLKHLIRESIRREEKARKKRDVSLTALRERFRKLKASNTRERARLRALARALIAKEKAERRLSRETYAFRFRTKGSGRGASASTGRRYSHAESDSLATHNVDPALVDLFIEMRREFSYGMEPDYRSEAFGEWVEEHPSEVGEYLAKKYEDVPEEPEPEDWRCNTKACRIDRFERASGHDAIPF